MIVALLLPLFLLAACGALLGRGNWLASSWSEGAGELTSKVLIPCLLFSGTYKNGLHGGGTASALLAFYVPVVLLFVLVAFAYRRHGNGAPLALASVYSNTVFVGIPVLNRVVGEQGLAHAFPIIAFHGLLAFTLYYFSSAWKGRAGLFGALLRTVKNPVVASLAAGLLLNASGLRLPAQLSHALDMAGAAALPCALLVLGASLVRMRVTRPAQTLVAVACKLLVLPALVLLCARLFGLADDALRVLLILSSCPVGVNAHPVVQADGRDATTVSSAIVLSSVAACVTIPLWLGVLAWI
ncbi:MAG: AEC family transporter [Pseudomonadota bacterium]